MESCRVNSVGWVVKTCMEAAYTTLQLTPSAALDQVRREAAASELESQSARWTGDGSVGDTVVRSILLNRAAELRTQNA